MKKFGNIIQIDPADNVAVALRDIPQGECVQTDSGSLRALDDIGSGHKIALTDIPQGADIVKYGTAVGHATRPIRAGEWVHTHNERTNLESTVEYAYRPQTAGPVREAPAEFLGYRRENGSVGIRNEIWIINTVGCVNKTAEAIAREASRRFAGKTDGILSFPHPYGCSQLGDDMRNTQLALAGLAMNPNAAGVLVLGLGCENNNIDVFRKFLADSDPARLRFLNCQDTSDEIGEGVRLVGELAEYAGRFARTPCPASELVIGLKCGGSDGFSGLTANPLLGTLSDRLIAQGGSTVLTEVPEMFGAEMSLMNRCESREVYERTVKLINDYKEYFQRHGQVIYDNPSPGNKAGGITTLEEKSCGCIRKGGSQNVVDVLSYGERVRKKGLNLLQGPGNDLVACSVLAIAGAQMVLFTTGRGTPYGGPVPTVKVSTNSRLYDSKPNWIDFNAGQLLDTDDAAKVEDDFFRYILEVASGRIQTQSERNGYRELAIFKDGVTE